MMHNIPIRKALSLLPIGPSYLLIFDSVFASNPQNSLIIESIIKFVFTLRYATDVTLIKYVKIPLDNYERKYNKRGWDYYF